MVKRILFSSLVVWALVDAALTAGDMPILKLKFYGFFASLFQSLLFVGGIWVVWESGQLLLRRNKGL